MLDLSWYDGVAGAWFLACWSGYVYLADHTAMHDRSVSARMNAFRRLWMRNMVRRELRMVDTFIHANLVNGVGFFASTAILLVGGLLAILGSTDRVAAVLGGLPFGGAVSQAGWQLKVLVLAVIFTYAFFKFAWCYRLFNYCSIMIGAAPLSLEPNPKSDAFADKIAALYGLAGRHFNSGLRAYLFALATLGWFIHAAVFILTASWVTYVIYRREFRSRSADILRTALELNP